MNVRDKVILKISSFPTIPAMAQKLLAVINDPNSDASEVGRVIQYDPALTANVLKAANSAFLGFGRPVSSIAEAGFRIGTKWLTQIALSSLIYANIKAPARGYELSSEDLWRHSIAVAIMSENLCKLLNIKDAGIIFTGGLVHDIGKIVMEESVSDCFEEIQQMVDKENISFEEAEERVLGVDHAEAGALIAENWRFPPAIVEVIKWHHNPEGAKETSPAIDIVHVADAICLMEGFGLGRDGLQYRCSEESLTRLKLSSKIIETAVSQLVVSLENMENMFSDIPAPSAVGR